MIETDGERVTEIVEWKYWKDFPAERQRRLKYCNAGVYAVRKAPLLTYMDRMARRPHEVRKLVNGEWVTIKEYFLTDLAEMMNGDGLLVGMTSAPAQEAIGVDSPESLKAAQELYASMVANGHA
jgi:bifunctional UDP-N-acetylglucosamine pyrophosphorylase/glucosamine-1-phosphate N-acetyltransferase